MTKAKQYILGALILVMSIIGAVVSGLPDGQLHLFFLNIGQGDSILIRSPSGYNILVDGGPGIKVIEELSAVLPFYERTIDLLILTHPDQDHIEGTIDVLKNYNIKKVLLTGIESKSPLYEAFLNEINIQQIPIEFAESEHDFHIDGDLLFDVIYPLESIVGVAPASPNNTSIVFKLTFHDQTILFTGDIEEEVEAEILASSQNLKSTVLKVPHHGSTTSSTKEFLESINPKVAVIQVAPENRHRHPRPEVLDRLQEIGVQQIYRNDLEGRIELVTDGASIEVKTERLNSSFFPLSLLQHLGF